MPRGHLPPRQILAASRRGGIGERTRRALASAAHCLRALTAAPMGAARRRYKVVTVTSDLPGAESNARVTIQITGVHGPPV